MTHIQHKFDTENPKRMEYAKEQITKKGIEITFQNNTILCFKWKGYTVQFFPYTGWHSGKSIKDGRGINNLLKQLQ